MSIEKDPDWCYECHCPIGIGDCLGCCAVASVIDDGPEFRGEDSTCEHCGKDRYDFSDLGCEYCDSRHPGFGATP